MWRLALSFAASLGPPADGEEAREQYVRRFERARSSSILSAARNGAERGLPRWGSRSGAASRYPELKATEACPLPSPFFVSQLEQLFSSLPTQERFYELALRRDEALVWNTLRKLEEEPTKAAILITGGFHTEGITQQLRANHVAYLVVSPTVSTKFDEERYHARLANRFPSHEVLRAHLNQQPALAAALLTAVGIGAGLAVTWQGVDVPANLAAFMEFVRLKLDMAPFPRSTARRLARHRRKHPPPTR